MQIRPETGTLVLRGRVHWARCGLEGVVADGDTLQLRALPPEPAAPVGSTPDPVAAFGGLAFDRLCRLFHARPADAAIDQVLWGATTATGVRGDTPAPWPVTAAGTEVEGAPTGALPQRPGALAVMAQDFLAVADAEAAAGAGCVWLLDLWQQEVSRAIALPSPPRDLATLNGQVLALCADGSTWALSLCEPPQRTPWPARPGAQRLVLAAGDGRGPPRGWVLVGAGTPAATLQALHRNLVLPLPHAADLLIEHQDEDGRTVFVVARRPGEHFLRLQFTPGSTTLELLGALVAPHFDGNAIEAAPDGRVAYWTVHGRLRHAAPARGRFVPAGRLFGFALDSGRAQCRWGRLQLQACVPPGTALTLLAFSADDLDPLAPTVPAPVLQPHPEAAALPLVPWQQRSERAQPLFRDPSPRALQPPPEDGFTWFDAPVPAGPGRHLWLVLHFSGSSSVSPRLREVRAEFPGHGLLSQLPRTLWREPAAQAFLHRLLMPVAALLDEWAAVSDQRHRLLDPRITPAAALPWLAGFVGLVLEPCWPEAAQRRLIGSAARLFRTRGTLASLREMLQLLTDAEVQIVEAFRLRGGGVVGAGDAVVSQAVLGGGFRVGGAIGEIGPGPVEGAAEPDFDDFAHRYTVIVHARLDAAQMEGVRRLIEHHQPAHTAFTLCSADAGLRAGLGGHVGLTAIVGRSGGFEPALVGDAVLGAGRLLGRPALDARLDGGGTGRGNSGSAEGSP